MTHPTVQTDAAGRVRADLTLTAESDCRAGDTTAYCHLRVGPEHFVLRTDEICEVISGCTPRAVPLAPRFVSGLLPYRGAKLMVIGLRRLLQLPDGPQGNCGDVLVLTLRGLRQPFGVLVDVAADVLFLKESDALPLPRMLDPLRLRLLLRMYPAGGNLLAKLDARELEPDACARRLKGV